MHLYIQLCVEREEEREREITGEMAQTGDCARKCKESGEVTPATKTRSAMEVTSSTGSFKRRKLASDVRDHHQFVSNRCDAVNSPDNHSVSAPVISEVSGRASVSRCSSNVSSEFVTKPELRSVDLKVIINSKKISFLELLLRI